MTMMTMEIAAAAEISPHGGFEGLRGDKSERELCAVSVTVRSTRKGGGGAYSKDRKKHHCSMSSSERILKANEYRESV